MKTIMPFFAMFVDPPSTLYERIYRLFLPHHPADRVTVRLRKCSTYEDLLDNGLRFIRIMSWRSRELCREEAPGNKREGGLGAIVCIFGGEGTRLEVLEGQ